MGDAINISVVTEADYRTQIERGRMGLKTNARILLLLCYVVIVYWFSPSFPTENGIQFHEKCPDSGESFPNLSEVSGSKNASVITRQRRQVSKPAKEPQVNIVLSEVNFDNVGVNKNQYLELEVTPKKKTGRPKGNMLEGLFVLVIETEPLQVVMSIHLGDHSHNIDPRKKYLVLGSPTVDNVNVDISSEKIHNIYRNGMGVDIFPTGDRGPVGFAVVFQPDRTSYSDLLLFKSPQSILLPTDLNRDEFKRGLIERLTIDFIAIGRKAPVSSCVWFDQLYPIGTDICQRCILRDWEVPSETTEHSLNRCADNELPFQSKTFKIGIPSPGFPNFCQGLHFNLEANIDMLAPKSSSLNSSSGVADCLADYANIPSSKYLSTSQESYKAVLQKHLRSPLCNCPSGVTENVTSLTTGVGRVTLPIVANYSYNKEWRSQCSKYLPSQAALLGYTHISSWVDIEVKPDECRFSCHFCKEFFKQQFRVDFKHKTNVMTNVSIEQQASFRRA